MPLRLSGLNLADRFIAVSQFVFFAPSAVLFFMIRYGKELLPDVLQLEPRQEVILLFVAIVAAGVVDVNKRDLKRRFEHLEEGLRNSSFNLVFRPKDGHLAARLAAAEIAEVVDNDPTARPESEHYRKERERLLRTGRLTMYRVAFVHDFDDVDAVESLCKRHERHKLYVACINARERTSATLVPLMILDHREVHFGQSMLPGDSLASSQHIGLLHVEIAAKFHESFRNLWSQAVRVKDEDGIRPEAFRDLRESLERCMDSVEVYEEDVKRGFQGLVALIKNEKRSIDIISHPTLDWSKPGRRNYYDGLTDAILARTRHRRIVWNRSHLDFLSTWLQKEPRLAEPEAPLEIRFLDRKPTDDFFHFDVLGGYVVILYLSVGSELWTKIQDQGFGRLMQSKFNDLWHAARHDVLKEENGPFDGERLQAIRERLAGVTPPAAAGASV